MPADLFDPAPRPTSPGSSRRATVTTSVVLHTAAVALLVLLPLAGSVPLPASLSRITDYVQAQALPTPPMPQPRAPSGPMAVGGNVTPPRRIAYVPPVYPPIAQAARVEGTVILEAIISERGDVTALKVLRSVPLLDEAARAAVVQWRYSPTTLNGVTIAVIMTVTVTFSLK